VTQPSKLFLLVGNFIASDMALSKFSIILLTLIVYLVLMIIVKRNRDHHEKVVVYSIGQTEFETSTNDNNFPVFGVLHIEQVLKKVDGGGNLTVVNYF
jgi:Ca2+/Na+ antiporter